MSRREDPMIYEYWNRIGGTLIKEYPIVSKNNTCARRLLDAIILPRHEKRIAYPSEVDIKGQDVIIVQAKASRLGMYLMGQAFFSAQLIKRFKPKSVLSVALCNKDDSVLRLIFEKHKGMRVEIIAV